MVDISCDVCKKNYKSKTYLSVHKKIHSNDKPYKCEDCDKSFLKKVYWNETCWYIVVRKNFNVYWNV